MIIDIALMNVTVVNYATTEEVERYWELYARRDELLDKWSLSEALEDELDDVEDEMYNIYLSAL